MKTKATKTVDLEQLRSDLATSPTMFLCAFEGLKVEEDYELRKQIRATGANYRVLKNRLARLASAGTPYESALSNLTGMTSMAFGGDDPIALAKALVAYGKEHQVLQFKAGVIEGRVLDVAGLNQLAALPGREDLHAKLLFLIQSPAQRLATVINAVGRNLAVVIDQGVQEKKFAS